MNSVQRKVALVVGAQGVIGRNLVEHLDALGDWEVIGLSRRGGETTGRVRQVSVDLLDRDDTAKKLSGLTEVTHVFYAAYQDRPTWAELVPPNLAMLVNVVDAIEPVAPGLTHVSLMQGYKVYGAHLGPFKTPARESDPGHMPPEFNVDQQAFLERRQRGAGWTWSALRPSVVCGFALGNPMNLAMVIAVYAAVSKELGLPLRFPGRPGAYDKLLEMTDAEPAGQGHRLGGDGPALRQPGVQHQQRRPLPLERDVAEDRPLLRPGGGRSAAHVTPGGHGGQGAALA
ncbi:SDR family oxidoreductase [Nonomuraea ferruginea]